jgi:GDSL-like Lipase/Acylhydrolase
MEERTLLSAAPIGIGSLGDSLTDEYQFYAPYRPAARNWVDILSALRSNQVTFGAYTTTLARGETRNDGYAQDWARSGATAVGDDVVGAMTTLINQYDGGYMNEPVSQPPGLLNQTMSNGQPNGLSNIDVATLLIGGNDYESALKPVLAEIPTLSTGSTSIKDFVEFQLLTAFGTIETDVTNGVENAVTAITKQDPNFPIVLVTPPNPIFTPYVQGLINALPSDIGGALTYALNKTAGSIDSTLYAEYSTPTDPNLKLVNLDKLFTTFINNPVIGGKNGTYIDPRVAGPSYTDLFVGDSFHPGTVGQALLANVIVGQIDTIPMFANRQITTLSDSEILAYAQKVQPVTTVKMTASPSSVILGSPITFTIQIPIFPNVPDPDPMAKNYDEFPATGSVTFIDVAQGNKVLGVTSLIPQGSGQTYTGSAATFTVSTLSAGMHQIVALCNGDTVYPVASTATTLVNVSVKPMQAQVFSAVAQLQTQLGVQIGEARLHRWNKLLSRGARPRRVARTAMMYLYSHTKLPRQQAVRLLDRAQHSIKSV